MFSVVLSIEAAVMSSKKWIKGVVLMSLILFIQASSQLWAQKYGPENYTKFDIEDNGDYTSFAMLDSVVDNYNVFFIGENHTFRTSNYKLQLKMLKYLHQKVGVRNLLLEFGHSRGWLVNQYIQTGDTNLLNVLTDYSYEEYTELYKALRKFNESLAADQKIRIKGIDIERAYSTSIKVLSMQLPDKDPPEEISLHIEAINGLATYNDEYYNKERDDDEKSYKSSSSYYKYSSAATVQAILENFEENEAAYNVYLGDKFPLFKKIMTGLQAGEERSGYKTDRAMQAHIFREQYMYKEFLKVVEEHPDEKFFSQFGRCHTPRSEQDSWCNFYAFKSLASRINNANNPHIKQKVMSIASYYPQSALYEKRMTDHISIAPMIDLANPEGLTLFRIASDTAIFDEFEDKFQFLIVNNNSLRGESTASTASTTSSYNYSKIHGHLDGTYGIINYDLSGLNSSFEAMGLPVPDGQMKAFGGGMTYIDFTGVGGGFRFHIYESITHQLGDTSDVFFGGHSFGLFQGADILYNNEWFTVMPAIGYGFAQLKLRVTEEGTTTAQQGFFVGNTDNETVYKNPAFYFDFSLDLRVNIKLISLGVKGGYQLDVSKKQWRQDGQIIDASPKTSLSGWWAGASVSLFFTD
jgi:hypothetical protein